MLIILDRAISFGGPGGPVASEVKAALYDQAKRPKVVSFVGGLGGRDITISGFKDIINKGIDIARTGSENEYEINCVRSRPGEITEDPETKNLPVWYDDTGTGGVKNLEVDMFVLSVALVPPAGIESPGNTIVIDINEHNFFKAKDNLLAPMDVDDAVVRKRGAVDRVSQAIS